MTMSAAPQAIRWRRIARALVAAGAALVAAAFLVVTAASASAHNVMVSSDPADGAVLSQAPDSVSFTFDQPVEDFAPALKVFGPNGNDFTTGPPQIDGTVVSAPMAAGPAGQYRAAFRVVSADGHPVTGEITFTLTDAAAGTATGVPTTTGGAPSVAPAPAGDSAGDSAGGRSGLGAWLWVGVAVAAVLIGAAAVIAVRRPRRP